MLENSTQLSSDEEWAVTSFGKDFDPHGVDQHAPGAKLDGGKVRPGLVMNGFANALLAVAEVGTYGANKYTDNGWKDVSRGFDRYTDAMYRHLLTDSTGHSVDEESGLYHAAHAAWNAMARLELMLRARSGHSERGVIDG